MNLKEIIKVLKQDKWDELNGNEVIKNKLEKDKWEELDEDKMEYNSEYTEIIFEDVEYQCHNETNEILDPEDFSVMGTWNKKEQSIDWEDKDAEEHHKEKKESL